MNKLVVDELRILITGGVGFIGCALVNYLLAHTQHQLLVLDKLTYAANLADFKRLKAEPRVTMVQGDICDANLMQRVFASFLPTAVMHLAAESHVDNSINAPAAFIKTNIVGTYTLLEAARNYWQGLSPIEQQQFRFHHISTDEVYGDLADLNSLFTEKTPYAPSSPYSASKASSDHLVRAWHRTYGLPVVISNCSNNYGPGQHSEKLIPKTISNALAGKPIPIYGDGQQIRDWLYVEDHVRALYKVVTEGVVAETYNIGGSAEKQNIAVAKVICSILEELAPIKNSTLNITNYESLITFVTDRPGHDKRYAIDCSKIQTELGWQPLESLKSGLLKTVRAYCLSR